MSKLWVKYADKDEYIRRAQLAKRRNILELRRPYQHPQRNPRVT